MNTACPTDDRLKQLICEAFDELPGADTVRLGQIDRKLGQQAPCHTPRRTNMRQWLFWVLFGASMTAAAWWAGTSFRAGDHASSSTLQEAPVSAAGHAQDLPVTPTPEQANKNSPTPPGTDTDSSVIYRRELY